MLSLPPNSEYYMHLVSFSVHDKLPFPVGSWLYVTAQNMIIREGVIVPYRRRIGLVNVVCMLINIVLGGKRAMG